MWVCANDSNESTAQVAATDLVSFDDGGYLLNEGDIPGLPADITLSATGCINATWSVEIRMASATDISNDAIFLRATVDNAFPDGMEGQAIELFVADIPIKVVGYVPGDTRTRLVSYTTWQCGLSAGKHNVKVQWVVLSGTVVQVQSRTLVVEGH